MPRDLLKNLQFRKELINLCAEDYEARQKVFNACVRDPIFFCNALLWTYNPKRDDPKKVPWILYPFQEDAVLQIVESIFHTDPNLPYRGRDCLVHKGRDLGFSWIIAMLALWFLLFHENAWIIMLSRDADSVDKRKDDSALFAKIDMMLKYLPVWLVPGKGKFYRAAKIFRNETNGALITADATTANAGVGARATAIFLDEFALFNEKEPGIDMKVWTRTAFVSNSRVAVSTPRGPHNVFGQLILKKKIHIIRAHWTMHPEYCRGLYYDGSKTPKGAKDFFVPGKGNPRSPWYDHEEERTPNAALFAAEVDGDLTTSQSLFFDPAEEIYEYAANICADPHITGTFDYVLNTAKPLGISQSDRGPFDIWFNPVIGMDGEQRPPIGKYVIGADISSGSPTPTGRSNSVLCVYDAPSRTKFAQYTTSGMGPEEFAVLACALGRWFCNAFIIWENNGPGNAFTRVIMRHGYGQIWYDMDLTNVGRKQSKNPGWHSSPQTKNDLLSNYKYALRKLQIRNLDRPSVMETLEFIQDKSGNVAHSGAMNTDGNNSEAKEMHGDRVIADALALMAIETFNLDVRPESSKPQDEELPKNCLESRRKQWEEEQNRVRSRWV